MPPVVNASAPRLASEVYGITAAIPPEDLQEAGVVVGGVRVWAPPPREETVQCLGVRDLTERGWVRDDGRLQTPDLPCLAGADEGLAILGEVTLPSSPCVPPHAREAAPLIGTPLHGQPASREPVEAW